MNDIKPYQKRLIAEYRHLKTNAQKLKTFIDDHEGVELNCPLELLTRQLKAMIALEQVLMERLLVEHLDPYMSEAVE